MAFFFCVKEMPKLVKLAPNGSADRLPLQESKKRKRPIGKSHALINSKPLTIVAPTPIATTRNEDSVNSTKYTTYASQTNPALVLKKKDSTVQCSQTTTIKTGVSGNIPVGIAVARQRYTQSSSNTEVQRQRETTTTTVSMPEVVHQSPMQTMVLSYNDCSMTTGSTAGINRWPSSGSCSIPQNTIGSQWSFQNTTLRAPALEQQTVQPVGYQLVQDQSGQYFLLPQNSIAGLMTMPFDYCKSETQNHHQPNQGYTLIQQPQQHMTTISPIINHHPQYTSIASSGSFLIQQVSSSTPPALINTHHQLTDSNAHQQPLIQLTSPENQMIIFNQQQSAIVAQPLIGHLQPPHSGLTIATQMQSGCQNQINDIQTVSESVTVQTKLVQQSITEKSTISRHTEENVSISLDYCNTTISEPEKDLKQDCSAPEQLLESEAIVSHDASNQTDLQTEDETYHPLTEENKESNFTESAQDCTDNDEPLTDGATQTTVLSIVENSNTPDITGLELLLNSIEQFEKRNSSENLDSYHNQEVVVNTLEQENVQTLDTNVNTVEETEEKGVNKIDLLLLAEQFLETEKSSETSEQDNDTKSYSNNNNLTEENVCSYEFEENTTKPLEVTINKNGTKKVYTKKSFSRSSDIFQPVDKLKVNLKLDTIKKTPKYSKDKVLNRKVSESSLSSSGQVKRGPGRPKKVLKCDDGNNNNGNNEPDIREKRLKLDCNSKTKHKTSSSSSSDLSPPVLEPWSPYSPRKVSTHTPPTLSPVSSMANVKKLSDDDKVYQKKIVKKRSTSSIIISEDEFRPPLKKRKVGRPRKIQNPFDEVIKKHLSLTPKKEKPVSISSGLLNGVSTIKINNLETASSGQYKIKPKLKAEVKIKHWDLEDEDDEIQDQDDILALPEFVCKKRRIADALHRMSPCTVNKPAVIPKKRKFSNVSLDSVESLDDAVSFPQRDTSSSSVPVRSQTSESSDISLEQTNEERDSSTTVELAERQCIPVSPSRPDVEITTVDDDHERRRLKKKRKHRKHKHSHDESRTKHKHKHHKKHHKKHKRHRDSELELSVTEPPTLSPQRLIEDTIEEDDDDDDNDDDKSKENDSSEVESSDVPTFLSDQQIWKWSGDSYKRPGRGGNKKTFYRSISRGDETISIGDCAVFLSSGQLDRPFIGKVNCMWETNQEKMQVKVFWFYHPEETASDFTGNLPYPGALFKSPHNDINDVQSIMNGCQVVSIEEFSSIVEKDAKRLKNIYVNNDLFYLAGDYEPVMKMINFSDGVVLKPSDT
ncbi:uncharacterized protein LOC111036220 isoform X4 [Myzus persicae]|uniref:uncharacterized protein LOC111036220 isoform X4 n=1 Tax=Myzus persicae TaxID=13164 RepID=UPI000B932216|nr:uncharacterized protein LOC111036220 isoform X4 [Myzus persicae]